MTIVKFSGNHAVGNPEDDIRHSKYGKHCFPYIVYNHSKDVMCVGKACKMAKMLSKPGTEYIILVM